MSANNRVPCVVDHLSEQEDVCATTVRFLIGTAICESCHFVIAMLPAGMLSCLLLENDTVNFSLLLLPKSLFLEVNVPHRPPATFLLLLKDISSPEIIFTADDLSSRERHTHKSSSPRSSPSQDTVPTFLRSTPKLRLPAMASGMWEPNSKKAVTETSPATRPRNRFETDTTPEPQAARRPLFTFLCREECPVQLSAHNNLLTCHRIRSHTGQAIA